MNKVMQDNSLADKKILCIEDEDLISRMYRKGLSRSGAKVIEAFDGDNALKLLSEHNIDVILLDLEMPNLNGFDTLRVIRSMPNYKSIPILIMSNASAIDEVETINWLWRMGVQGIMLKCDVSLAGLVDNISNLIKRNTSQKLKG